MGERDQLSLIFRKVLGSSNVYFQPPPSVRMDYPCIVYERSIDNVTYADNTIYRHTRRYNVTVIDFDPDTRIPDDLLIALPMTKHIISFVKDNLNHYVYQIYY